MFAGSHSEIFLLMNIRNRPYWRETRAMNSDRELQDEEVCPAQTSSHQCRCRFRLYQPLPQALSKADRNTILLLAGSGKQPANKQTCKAQ